jgi:AcrR family transcriptional regulator
MVDPVPAPVRGVGAIGGIRARNREAIEREILVTARRHLAEHGAAALSLRAIARDLGMVSSALYRYVSSRDELLTLLIVAAYDDLGDSVDDALAAARGSAEATGADLFSVIVHAVRRWALANPHDYALLYGSPVPGYHAPAERTTGPGTRVQVHLVEVLAGPARSGYHAPPTSNSAALAAGERALAPIMADPLLAGGSSTSLLRGLAAWSLVLGAISAELFEQFGAGAIADPDAYFDAMVTLANDLVFPGRQGQ